MAYLDSAMERRQQAAQVRFADSVEAFRAGAIFAQSDKQYNRWRQSQKDRRTSLGLTGNALEQAVMHLRTIPGATVVDATIAVSEMARRDAAVAATQFVPHPGTLAR